MDEGETTKLLLVIAPGFQVYDTAPEAVNVAVEPTHIAVGLLKAATVGFGFTVKLNVLVLLQPPVEPVTV